MCLNMVASGVSAHSLALGGGMGLGEEVGGGVGVAVGELLWVWWNSYGLYRIGVVVVE